MRSSHLRNPVLRKYYFDLTRDLHDVSDRSHEVSDRSGYPEGRVNRASDYRRRFFTGYAEPSKRI